MGEGGFVAQALWIVAGGDEERRSGVGPDAECGDQLGRGLIDQGLQDGVELGDLLFEGDGTPGEHPKAELGERDDVALGPGPIGRGSLEEVEHVEASELVSDGLGGGRNQTAHLVERLGPTLAGRCSGDAQNPHGFDVSVPGLGLAAGVAREGRPGSRDGILGIGLALEPAPLSIGTVDLDDPDLFTLETTGQAGAIGARPFDADQLDGAEVAQPAQQLLVAAFIGAEALDTEESSSLVQSRSYMDVEVRIDPAGDAPCHSGHCHPFVGLVWGDTAPSGTTDRTATALYEAGS